MRILYLDVEALQEERILVGRRISVWDHRSPILKRRQAEHIASLAPGAGSLWTLIQKCGPWLTRSSVTSCCEQLRETNRVHETIEEMNGTRNG